jgi:hypothetical protein
MRVIEITRCILFVLAEFSVYRARRSQANHSSAPKGKQSQNVFRQHAMNMINLPDDDDDENEYGNIKKTCSKIYFLL